MQAEDMEVPMINNLNDNGDRQRPKGKDVFKDQQKESESSMESPNLEFEYGDTDTLTAELSELYSYTEEPEFALNRDYFEEDFRSHGMCTRESSSERVRVPEDDEWHGDPLEADLFDDEEGNGVEGVVQLEEDEFYPDSSQWEAEEEEKEEEARDEQEKAIKPPSTAAVTEKVNKETSMDGLLSSRQCSVVRPKERRPDVPQQNPFMRGNTIIRSKTFSPGPQSQYICRINRSDSDSSTLSKKSPFVRNASERRSMRMKKPPVQVKGLDGLLRTSLDLELDLQVSRTRQARLTQELRVLRELKAQLEKARQQGQRELPAWVQEDERFRLLLKQAEKQTREEQLQEQRVEKMMRAAAKDVHKIRGQSRKEVPEVQTFREKMAFFTRAKTSIPDLPADDV